jgi:cysteine desulfurase
MTLIIYFDNNATTKVADEVVDAMLPFLKDLYGNPSSMHSFGGQVEKHIRSSRESLAALLGCDNSELIFTSGGTESDNAAIKGVLAAYPEKKKIVTTRVEHPAVLATCRELQAAGFSLVELGVDKYGQINLDELAAEVDEHTAIVSIMYANNETGVIFPIDKIAEIVKSKGAIFHTDAVQAVGKIPLNLDKSNIDLLSLSGHKLHASKGIGASYIKKGTRISPFIIGGHQEKNRRAGTENVPSIVGLGKAAEIAEKEISSENTKVRKLRDKLENAILKTCKDAMLNGDKINRLPNTVNISFEFIEGSDSTFAQPVRNLRKLRQRLHQRLA